MSNSTDRVPSHTRNKGKVARACIIAIKLEPKPFPLPFCRVTFDMTEVCSACPPPNIARKSYSQVSSRRQSTRIHIVCNFPATLITCNITALRPCAHREEKRSACCLLMIPGYKLYRCTDTRIPVPRYIAVTYRYFDTIVWKIVKGNTSSSKIVDT